MFGTWKRGLGAVAPILVAVTLAVAWLAPASSAQTEIRVLDREGAYEKDIDLGKSALSAGDVTFEAHRLIDAADGTTVVGRDFDHLTVLRVVAGGQDLDFLYDSILRFPDGDIALYGEARYSSLFTADGATFAVIGGTGAYAAMRGTATFTATATEGEFLIVVDLTG